MFSFSRRNGNRFDSCRCRAVARIARRPQGRRRMIQPMSPASPDSRKAEGERGQGEHGGGEPEES